MARRYDRWSTDGERQRRFTRPVGCLLWLVALLVILIVLSVLFGGFQKGTKAGGLPAQRDWRQVAAQERSAHR
jgi:hypothetical protein